MISINTLPAAPSSVASGQFARASRVLEDAIAAHAFPGCAWGVLAGGEVLAEAGLGRFTYEDGAPAVDAKTIYDIASITKVAATTAAAMLLRQRGLLDLDTTLGDLLPGFVAGRAPGDLAREVRIRHLLAHNSGLPGYVEFFRTAGTASELYRACMELPVEASPGERAVYSDPGFILLGKALEAVTGESLAVWTEREVFAVLGMGDTGFCPAPGARALIPPTEEDTALRRRRIQGEVQDENAWVLHGVAGHAGLFSSVRDLLRFAGEILLAGSRTGKARVFEADTVEEFARRQSPPGSSRALGWDTPSGSSSSGRHFSARSIGHLGFSGCSLWIDRESCIAIALLTNRTWPDRRSDLIRAVRPAFYDAVRESL